MSYAVWHSDIARAHVTTARGIHFSNMGHSVARVTLAGLDDMPKIPKRLELLPEEALYLVERGAMFCWKASELPVAGAPAFEDMEGEPMTVQQAFAEMIGTEDLTLEKYQVFAYLKRLGYVVTRTRPPSEAYPASAPFPPHQYPRVSFLRWILSCLTSPLKRLLNTFTGAFDWWKPLRFNRWLHHNMSYPSVYKSLRFLPSGHKEPLYIKTPDTPSPYQIFFNLYKPSTSFKKTAPPAPDFSMVVVNARTTAIPSLSELNDLFGSLPELPPPVPRRRTLLPQKPAPLPTPAVQPKSFLQRIFPWAFPTLPQGPVARKTNPFAVLKAGTKMVVVAVVDAGTISFFRFGPGAFEDFPMN
ncbi:hypothetical protein PHLCEN_2v7550 [Hermanssonia centrifuga]|uniref:tRNA-splicing endonuclease subunit Sen54 N-terminal domain-containing protein n=1 Tax=Hermanssonia centrifuga TaxID=98765 RepID=A0A2R6NWD2_9APHY|nr:hypothetical protein PHLCEN_2v7550 [Hermanssonia centrifuga]